MTLVTLKNKPLNARARAREGFRDCRNRNVAPKSFIVSWKMITFAQLEQQNLIDMIKIFPTYEVKQLDAYTIENEPIASIDLMERASQALTTAIAARWTTETPFVVFAGPGNNGGDALAVARLMAHKGYRMEVYLFNPKDNLSADCEENKQRLMEMEEVTFHEITTQFIPPTLTSGHVVIDGLFGSGLNKPLSGGFASVVKYINASPATIVAIDVPSGLMGEENSYTLSTPIVHAHLTLTLQQPKLSFLFAENASYVGEWEVLDIGLSRQAIEEIPTPWKMMTLNDVRQWIKPRAKHAHKGTFGRGLLIAGSEGMAGASILSAKGALRSGIGLLTVHLPYYNNVIVQTAVPEAMTEMDVHNTHFAGATDTEEYQAVAIGPGLGQARDTELAVLDQISSTNVPMVIDADALNILGANRNYLTKLPKGSILTPHPKEMERLVGKCSNSYERIQRASELAAKANVYIVLKGAYTAIIQPDGEIVFNTTGNPGMATGGSGDVLTGILLALLAQGYESSLAARLGVFLHGMAGDIAADRQGEVAMTASDIIDSLPQAWKTICGK